MADEKTPDEKPAPEPPRWENRTELKIQGKMKEVVKMTIDASGKEIAVLRRKIERLTYGS